MKILVSGANGYIGSRLLLPLIEAGHEVYALIRTQTSLIVPLEVSDSIRVVTGDLLDLESMRDVPKDFDIAFYLVHSMSQSGKRFDELEKECVTNFVLFLAETQVKQVIYMGGLIEGRKLLSRHLASRKMVEDTLIASGYPCTIFRAGIIVGAGSASFEIIRDLVEKLPVMVAPKWVNNRTQPIAVSDVLEYLVQSAGNEKCLHRIFEIGGPKVMTYRELLLQYAEFRGLNRWILTVPVLTPRLSSYWLFLVTSTNFYLAQALVDSLKNEAVCSDSLVQDVLPQECLSFKEALKNNFTDSVQSLVHPLRDPLLLRLPQVPQSLLVSAPCHGCIFKEEIRAFRCSFDQIVDTLWNIGGEKGWFFANWAWRLRGWIDFKLGGVGLRPECVPKKHMPKGFLLGFWSVLAADRQKGHLLFYAEMKIPGEAWLEFRILPDKGKGGMFSQLAIFRPKGIMGRLYWYLLYPIHWWIFRGMINAIINESEK